MNSILKKIESIEKQSIKTFNEEHTYDEQNKLCYSSLRFSDVSRYLYHGLRYGNVDEQLKTLRKIIDDGAILCSSLSECSFSMNDGCNGDEYISLMENNDNSISEFNAFVGGGISLIIDPKYIDAIKTDYLTESDYYKIKDQLHNYKHRYSWAKGEYQVKEKIDLKHVVAIGIPTHYFLHADVVSKIQEMFHSNFHVPIVNISSNNYVLEEDTFSENEEFSSFSHLQEEDSLEKNISKKEYEFLFHHRKKEKKEQTGYKVLKKSDYKQSGIKYKI